MDRRLPLTLVISALGAAVPARPAEISAPQIDQARQFEQREVLVTPALATADFGATGASSSDDDESFGVQQLLRDAERFRAFRAFADVSAFVTNNVALAPRAPQSDAFLTATFGFEYRRPFRGVQVDAFARATTFRYDKFYPLDFTSLDFGVGLSYRLEKFGGLDVFARYGFNELISVATRDVFFKNHTITVGAQKTVPLSQAHYWYVGAAAQIGFADPRENQRSELSGFAGYHLAATRRLDADVLYRYSYFLYSETDRRDHNHTASLSLTYKFTEWFSAGASTYWGWNRSNYQAFEYDVANGGASLTLGLRF